MSTVPDPLNSTTNPFITGGGGSGSQKHYQQLTFSGITNDALGLVNFNAYAMRGGHPIMYKNFTGVPKRCRKASAGYVGPTGQFSIYQIYKNDVLFESITTPTWTAFSTGTLGINLTSTLVIAPDDEIRVVGASGTGGGANAHQYFSLLLEWDGDLP